MVRIIVVLIIILIVAIIAAWLLLRGASVSRPSWYQKQLDDEQMNILSGKKEKD